MKIIVLGVCGKLMAGIACLAAELGHHVVGYDRTFSPPMSDILKDTNIELCNGYPDVLDIEDEDVVIVGNQMRRNDSLIQDLINRRHRLYSGPEWLLEFVLRKRFVIAVSGCHGKTTTSAMITWMLKKSGHDVGYLIGGVSKQLGHCAALGSSQYFVIEADEYDSAFFDKRPKFIHYWPSLLVMTSFDFDHADIYANKKDLMQQYGYLLRLLAPEARVITYQAPKEICDQIAAFSLKHWRFGLENNKKTDYAVGDLLSKELSVIGDFNKLNALAAMLTGMHLEIDRKKLMDALSQFKGVARRQALHYKGDVSLYDDFAHHPAAVQAIVKAFKAKGRVLVVYHPGTYTQRQGTLDTEAISALSQADHAWILLPPKHQIDTKLYHEGNIVTHHDQQSIIQDISSKVQKGDSVVVLSAYYLESLLEELRNVLSVKSLVS